MVAVPAPKFNPPQLSAPKQSPYWPNEPADPFVFEQFEGMNTSTTRPGVDDKQGFWFDGFMPVGPRYLRTMWGVGDPISFTDSAPIAFFQFANIGATPYCIVVHTDGSIHAVNTDSFVQTEIAPAGTITNPSRLNVGLSQYGSQYVIIVTNQPNGYFLWDGVTFYKAGGLGPVITITAGGTGYVSAPTVSTSGGSGSGATFSVTISGGAVTAIQVTNPGTGWTAGQTVNLSITGGGGSGATATAVLMPFAISGTAVETYTGRVWIVNGPVLTFSAPGSVTDFSTNAGGGNTTSSDSFLRVRYIQLLQTNGFLYLIADSSVNYISGVQTSGSPITTTFTNQNADPEVGTPWPSTVSTLGRNILFANAFGVHVSYGAAVTKISEPLDGVYNTVSNFGSLIPSSAKAIIFGKKVWMLLLPIVDPVTGQQVNKLLLWNELKKHWWASEQDVPLQYIQSQEIDSVITAWGSTGTAIYPLFQTPSTAFQKTAQSRLKDAPGGYMFTKSTARLWGIFKYFSFEQPDITISIDNGVDVSDSTTPTLSLTQAAWVTQGGLAVSWTTQTSLPVRWFVTGAGFIVLGPESVGQNGVMLGLTATTDAADMAIVSLTIDSNIHDYRG